MNNNSIHGESDLGEQERDVNLAILIILLLLCWPAGIIYYFTCPMRPKAYYVYPQPYQPLTTGTGPVVYCTHCGAQIPAAASFCPTCGAKLK